VIQITSVINDLVWREHEGWLEERARLAVERERWTGADWAEARRVADAAWDANPVGLYLYAAEEALREQHYRRTTARLDAEARLDVDWLLGLIGGRDVA
jgi:hypothetical protein